VAYYGKRLLRLKRRLPLNFYEDHSLSWSLEGIWGEYNYIMCLFAFDQRFYIPIKIIYVWKNIIDMVYVGGAEEGDLISTNLVILFTKYGCCVDDILHCTFVHTIYYRLEWCAPVIINGYWPLVIYVFFNNTRIRQFLSPPWHHGLHCYRSYKH